ncbi:MAG: uncharacterized protein JWP87_2159 [Labilithrix sp.]|nr:uncharacterized protein [Labilithrix sp.]
MTTFPRFSPFTRLAHAAPVLVILFAASCTDSPLAASPLATPKTLPGEICVVDNGQALRLTFDPPSVVVAAGEQRSVRLIVEPDICEPTTAAFTSDLAAIAEPPPDPKLDLRHATYDFLVKGGAFGLTKIKATMSSRNVNGDPVSVTAELPVDVRHDRAAPTCTSSDVAAGTMAAGSPQLRGTGALSTSYLSAPAAAFARDDEFALPAFPAKVECAGVDLASAVARVPLRAVTPAVSFEAGAPLSMAKSLRREIEVAMPVNPAAFPPGARMRHLLVLFKSVRAQKPRAIPVANPRIDPDGAGGYVLKFQTPWLGTYQAAVAEDAGLRKRKRKLTHRAVMGFSMGGGGAAIFGLRHHDKFDVVAPLGGPSDWTWLLWYIEQNALGGFCPAGKTCPKVAPNRYPMDEAYAHTMDYEHWFFEKGTGNGGSFPRSEYVQIFEDLALSLGNPNGSSADPSLLHVALGPTRDHAWIKGDPSLNLPPGTDCSFTIEPINDDPDQSKQRDIEAKCKAWRCDPKNQYHADTNYFDDEYNPDGTLPVISFCDGNQEPSAQSPYVNSWAPGGDQPVNLGLAVDLNKNGIRDQGEPVIRSGHEPYDDCGPDQLCDVDEPGYNALTNPDPNQDDYDYQLDPSGTEGNHRYDDGEKFSDFGLDGVPNTANRHIAGDVGENDGKFTQSIGLTNFYANDPHGIVSRRVTDVPGGVLSDEALGRIDILSDGGVRDLFNFAVVANHLSGQIYGRKDANGLPLRSVAFFNGFHFLPGEPQDKPSLYNPFDVRWADVADMPNVRYGDLDASREIVERDGDGQHVGTTAQLSARLLTAFFFAGKAWPGADRTKTEESNDNPADSSINELGVDCEVRGPCTKIFTGKRSGRTGPIAISVPPGYAQKDNVARNTRYPVLYVLHGYGQDPRDLAAVAVITNNYMNGSERSYATRLPKFIIVYVDGRCRVRPDGKPECIRGTFYMNSARPDGSKLDDWFDEVTEYVDQNYRTMPPTEVDVTD